LAELTQLLEITKTDFPAVFQVADRQALHTKRSYLLAARANLLLILIGAISTSWAVESAEGRSLLAIIGALSLSLGLLLSLYVKLTDAEKTWFAYRAVAESIKTMSWRYLTRAEPYNADSSIKHADQSFGEQLGLILQMPRNPRATLTGDESVGEQITATMRKIRE
jgi:hypothetical protein